MTISPWLASSLIASISAVSPESWSLSAGAKSSKYIRRASSYCMYGRLMSLSFAVMADGM